MEPELVGGITALKRSGVTAVDGGGGPSKRQRQEEGFSSCEDLEDSYVDYQVDQACGGPNDLLQGETEIGVPEGDSELQAVGQRMSHGNRQEQDSSTDENVLVLCVGSDEDDMVVKFGNYVDVLKIS